jgi:hypothetical protein
MPFLTQINADRIVRQPQSGVGIIAIGIIIREVRP